MIFRCSGIYPENNGIDILPPRLFARTGEKAGVIHPFNPTPALKDGAIEIPEQVYELIRLVLLFGF